MEELANDANADARKWFAKAKSQARDVGVNKPKGNSSSSKK